MKRQVAILARIASVLFLFAGTVLAAPVILVFEDFERTGSARQGVEYTSIDNTGAAKVGIATSPVRDIAGIGESQEGIDRFGVFNLSELAAEVSYSNIQGSDFFTVDDQDFRNSSSDFLNLDWNNIDISGLSEVDISWFLAEDDEGGNEDWEDADAFKVQYRLDSDVDAFTDLFSVHGPSAGNGAPRVDANNNDEADLGETEITDTFTQFTRKLSGLSLNTTLDLRVRIESLAANDEDIAFDNVTVAVAVAVPEPSAFAFVCLGLSMHSWRRRRNRVSLAS